MRCEGNHPPHVAPDGIGNGLGRMGQPQSPRGPAPTRRLDLLCTAARDPPAEPRLPAKPRRASPAVRQGAMA